MASSGKDSEQLRKLFVGGLNYRTTEEGLRTYYSQWGEISDCVVMNERDSGRSRGFGFVTYIDPSMVDEAMKNRPHTIDGRQVQPKRAIARGDASSPGANSSVNKVFIGGIRDKPVGKEDLETYFSQFGEIMDCVLMMDKVTGSPRGFAFVQFNDYDPVDKIVLTKFHRINGVNVEVKKAIPRDSIAAPPRPRGGGGGFYARGGGGGYHPYGRRGGSPSGGRMNVSHDPSNQYGPQYGAHCRYGDGYGDAGYGSYRGGGGGGQYANGGGASTYADSYGPPNSHSNYNNNDHPSNNYGQGPSRQQHNATFHGFESNNKDERDDADGGFDVYGGGNGGAAANDGFGTRANTAYGFGGWGLSSGDKGGDIDGALVGYPAFGQNYEQSRGGGPLRGGGGASRHSRGGDAGVIGSGRPAPYSGGAGGRNV